LSSTARSSGDKRMASAILTGRQHKNTAVISQAIYATLH
jgi:hypothetical protein